MATLAEILSHGRCPKSSNTKPVKLFPPGLLVYTTEKPPSVRGEMPSILVSHFLLSPLTPPLSSHSFRLLLMAVCLVLSVPLVHQYFRLLDIPLWSKELVFVLWAMFGASSCRGAVGVTV